MLRWGVGAAVGALGLGLTGCGVRLDDGATVPFLTRQRMPDEDLLLAAYRHEVTLARDTSIATSPDPAIVTTLRSATTRHTEHAAAVRAVLVAGGVPDRLIDPAASPSLTPPTTTGPSPSPSPVAAITVEAVREAALLASSPTVVADLDRAEPSHALLLASYAAHAAVLVALLGGQPAAGVTVPADAAATVAAALLPGVRAAAYAVELAAARIPAADRAPALATVAWLRTRERASVAAAGKLAPAPSLGFRLPAPVTNPTEATQAIRAALAGLVSAGLTPLAAPERSPGTSAAVVEAHITTIQHALPWGVPLGAFPGLTRT